MSDFKEYWKNYEDENYVLGSEEYCAQQAWKHQQAKIDDLQKTIVSLEAGLRKNSSNKQKLLSKNIELQKRVGEYEDLTTSIRNEFNLWTDGREFADVIEAQIENLEALRGEHENSN